MRGPVNKEVVLTPSIRSITGTPTEIWSGQVGNYSLLTFGVFNSLGSGQTVDCTIQRRQPGGQWKDSYLFDLQGIANGIGRSVDIDIRGTIELRVLAQASGVGGDIEIEVLRLQNAW